MNNNQKNYIKSKIESLLEFLGVAFLIVCFIGFLYLVWINPIFVLFGAIILMALGVIVSLCVWIRKEIIEYKIAGFLSKEEYEDYVSDKVKLKMEIKTCNKYCIDSSQYMPLEKSIDEKYREIRKRMKEEKKNGTIKTN
ncbi:hypothetical protein M2146_002507 [Lachnospiraceae bacterium PF1-22]